MANENDVLVIDGVLSICLDKKATSVVIPKDVKEIGYRTFCGCESLKSVKIPEGLKEICKFSFFGCNSLSAVEFGGTKAQWEAVKGKGDLLDYVPDKVINCSDGEWKTPVLLVEDGIVTNYFDLDVTKVVIPEGVTGISRHAFNVLDRLSILVIPESVTEIDSDAFEYCESLRSVEFDGTKTQWEALKDIDHLFPNSPVKAVWCTDGRWKKPVLRVKDGVVEECLDRCITSTLFLK